jgi:poly(3-hydroxybutyrate) depolymerase
VDGTARSFYVQLPSNYSASTPHPVVFQFHWLGGTAEQALTFYQLNSLMPNAIFVTPQGLVADDAGDDGWPNTNGQDVDFTKAMIQYVETNYCVDTGRIFSTGFSYGGIMSITLGCQMSDVFRAIAPESGMNINYYPACNPTHPIAVWQSEGNSDTTVTPANAQAANNIFVTADGCSSTTAAVNPSPCVEYQGCQTGYPVTWCLFNGGHEPFNNTDSGFGSTAGPDAIAAFFNQF